MTTSLERDAESVRAMVRQGYTRVAETSSSCCGSADPAVDEIGRRIGYSDEQLAAVPTGANLGVGCGNPTAIDGLRPGEVVVDLGSGAGMDAFLAARQVGESGHVIGVDMTDGMLDKARANAERGGFANVEFRMGTIEALPIGDESVDVILSNCVINLSPEKDKVFREAYRVLRPGGRLQVSDIVLDSELPAALRGVVETYIGCIGGASQRARYLQTVRDAGFQEVRVDGEKCFGDLVSVDDPQVRATIERAGVTAAQAREFLRGVTSIALFARK